MNEDNRDLYAAYRRAHGGNSDPYTRYWPFMSDSAKEWYNAHNKDENPAIVAKTLEELAKKAVKAALDKLFP